VPLLTLTHAYVHAVKWANYQVCQSCVVDNTCMCNNLYAYSCVQSHTRQRACSQMGQVLAELWLDNNDFEGDLSALGPTRLAYALVHDNPKLCGMVRHVDVPQCSSYTV